MSKRALQILVAGLTVLYLAVTLPAIWQEIDTYATVDNQKHLWWKGDVVLGRPGPTFHEAEAAGYYVEDEP